MCSLYIFSFTCILFDPVWCKRVKYKHLYWKNGILCLLIWCGVQLCVLNETSWLDDDDLANEFSVVHKEGSPVVFFVLHKVSEDADKFIKLGKYLVCCFNVVLSYQRLHSEWIMWRNIENQVNIENKMHNVILFCC